MWLMFPIQVLSGTNASGEEVGLSGLTQSDEEQLADKADETHISGGNDSMSGTSSVQGKDKLIGGVCNDFGLAYFFMKIKHLFYENTRNKTKIRS